MATRGFPMKVTKLPSDDLALTNKIFVSPQDAKTLKEVTRDNYVQIKEFVFTFGEHPDGKTGFVGLSAIQRRFLNFSLNEPIDVLPFTQKLETIYLSKLILEVDFLTKAKRVDDEFKVEDITKTLSRELNNQFFTVNQKVVADVNGVVLDFRVKSAEVVDLTSLLQEGTTLTPKSSDRGILHTNTTIGFERAPGGTIKLVGGADGATSNQLFKPGFNFENMGIGGLDKEFGDIFRRAFASRIFPPSVVQKLGIQHVKGILLYGPPGTGKTLMARQIGKMLNGKEPKIVNGPEVLNKYVGQSEENIRNLFREAEIEYKERGEGSDLHIIIFDEIDAICKQRGMRQDGTGVGDTVVNQLLTKIDGVDSLNNILLIGMTNRKDLIDEALLRPGRLEVQMEISLPDEKGRVQILNIHTRRMRDSDMMDPDVDIQELAVATKNFSGAEIEGLVKSATSFAFNRQIDATNGIKIKEGKITVARADFMEALKEIKPAFGKDTNEFKNCIRNGIIKYGPRVEKLLQNGALFVQQVRNSSRTPLVSVLLEGPPGSGKTALAAKLASESDYPYVKLISAENLVGYSETAKCSKITKIFDDAYKSPVSCVVVDDIERILDYVRIGPRFSNAVLQTLLVFLKKEPEKGRKLLILVTTGNRRILEDLELLECFSSNAILTVPQISTKEEFVSVLKELGTFTDELDLAKAATSFTHPLSVKKLIMIAEMAKQVPANQVCERFCQIMIDSE